MDLVPKILNHLSLSKSQRRFIEALLLSILITRGKITLRNLSRYSGLCEKTFSRQFSKPMAWVDFHRAFIDEVFDPDSRRVVAFDASFIPKAGKHTFGRSAFWNGCHSRSEKGLEISTVAIIDLTRNQGLTLSVKQTQPVSQDEESVTLMDRYVDHIRQIQPHLLPRESHICVDGGLARKKFIDGVCEIGCQVIGKLRHDARMRYLYHGPKRAGRGRQKTYDGKVDWTDPSRLDLAGSDETFGVYTAVLNHPCFKRNLRVVRLVPLPTVTQQREILLFSTDTTLDPWMIYHDYKARFQIEFIYRDAKQFTGLADAQVRDRARLDFHFNAALATLNLAKAQQMHHQPKDQPATCYIANVKAEYFNQHYLERFISIFELDPTWIKKHPGYQMLREYGKIAA